MPPFISFIVKLDSKKKRKRFSIKEEHKKKEEEHSISEEKEKAIFWRG